MTEAEAVLAEGRACNGCTMCCKLLSISELEKPRMEWCPHCDIGVGCRIYDTRPAECRQFHCGYLLHAEFGEHWYPARCRMVVAYEAHANRVVVHVDPGRVGAWRREPFYSEIKRWAVGAAADRGQVLVWQGPDAIVVLPDREKNLGAVREDQFIITSERMTPAGAEFDVFVVEKDDPRVAALNRQPHHGGRRE